MVYKVQAEKEITSMPEFDIPPDVALGLYMATKYLEIE